MVSENGDTRLSLGRNLTHGLLDSLGRSIVTGQYADRAFPTEAELSKLHGVSRTVTREAVKMLTAKGLVSARPRQGTIVEPVKAWNLFDADVLRWLLERRFTPELLRQFCELRIAIEPAAAALAATTADTAGIALIRTGFARMQAADIGEDDTLDADIAFHLAILHASGNPFFAQFRDIVATALKSSIRLTNRIQGRSADLNAHGAVLTAIEKRRPAAAHKAMTTIIADVMTLLESESMQGGVPG